MLRVGPLCCLVTILSVFITASESARILGLFPSQSKSHLIIHWNTIRPLIERGHDVTIVTTLPLKEAGLKFRHIQLLDQPDMDITSIVGGQNSQGILKMLKMISTVTSQVFGQSNQTVNAPEMRKLMDEESFDLVVLGYFFNDFLIGVAGHFKCPVIINFSGSAIPIRYIGNPLELTYVPHVLTGLSQPMNFLGRVVSFLVGGLQAALNAFLQYNMQRYYESNFPADKYPSYDEMKRNVSMLFISTYLNQGFIQPNVPGIVHIGGIQIKPTPDPLPEDIQKHLDSASEDGAIYFCLGSNVKSEFLGPDFVQTVFKVMSSIKQKVLWKWDGDELPGKSPNILYKNWLPQDDVLAHRNVKLFITHAGGGGVTEAQYHGVPMVAIPFFADQFSNANKIEKSAYGLSLNKDTITEELLRKSVLEVLQNSTYRDNVQSFSRIYRDRPMSARDTAAYWMEYVIRHRGAKHLQSPAVHMSTIAYYGLDVFAFLFAVIYVVFKVSQLVWRKTIGALCSKFCRKNKTVSKNKKTH